LIRNLPDGVCPGANRNPQGTARQVSNRKSQSSHPANLRRAGGWAKLAWMTVLRPYRSDDRDAVYEICLRTGASGEDASGMLRDPDLLGHVYAGPYVTLEPELAFVVVDDDGVGGYILGAADTAAFEERVERQWWPDLRRRYPTWRTGGDVTFDDVLVARMHSPRATSAALVADYPSHLHIDLLPRLQGQGWGRRLVDTLAARLRSAGSSGVHLGVAAENTRAHDFYRRVGFTEVARDERSVTFAMRL
jgi:ribosomal protein S18 acetylase RimI-like enzyme